MAEDHNDGRVNEQVALAGLSAKMELFAARIAELVSAVQTVNESVNSMNTRLTKIEAKEFDSQVTFLKGEILQLHAKIAVLEQEKHANTQMKNFLGAIPKWTGWLVAAAAFLYQYVQHLPEVGG